MSIGELENELGITFHDALVRTLSVDYVERAVEFVLAVCVGNPDAPTEQERERRRMANLRLTGLEYLAIDPPDPRYPYQVAKAVDVDPCDADPQLAARYRIPEGAFESRFFVSNWNAFIHFAAMSAGLTWLEPE